MLVLPLILVDLSTDRISVQENRGLANPPILADFKKQPVKFIRDFDKWFKDSTGFREQYLTLYNNTIGKNIPFNGVTYTVGPYTCLIGEQGHHYFANTKGGMIPKFQGKQYLSDEQLRNMAAKLEKLKIYLDSKGIPLTVMFCTDKESVYPEFYPKSIKRGPEPIQLDFITKYLQNHTSVDVFNIRQAMLAEKDNYLLYPASGNFQVIHHYTQIGAFFAYRELMKHITVHFPWMFPYEMDNIEISYDKNKIPYVALKTENTYKKLNPSFFDGVNIKDIDSSFNVAFENMEAHLPTILLLRTSFSDEAFTGKFIAQHFSKTIMIYFINMSNIEEYISRFNPDIVVFETVEYQLGWFANFVAEIPDL
jgi:hypothetical protein